MGQKKISEKLENVPSVPGFSHASYSGSPSGSALTGGQDQGANINDAGTVSITVNGFSKSSTYNQSSTASSIASALSTAFNGDVNSPVSTSVSGAQVTLTAKSGGATTNYSLSTSSATTQSGFTGTSFPASPSGGALTGGANSSQTPTTPYSVNLAYFPDGDVNTANDTVNGNWTYGYDDFNRLISSSKTGAAYTYKYDRYGNRWQQNGPFSFVTTFSGGNNRMDGYSYDAAGNVLNDNAGHSFTYDAENRIVQVGTNVFYVYDGDGRRIRKTVSGTSVDYFYDLGDHETAEMNSSGNWNRGEVFAGDRHIATYNQGTTFFNHLDWLGTERSRTALSGTLSETCLSLPFGDGQSCSGNETTPNHLTGKERDSESGLDYFGARYYSSTMGRWMSPDWSSAPEAVPYVDLSDPQSLNLYGYVRNNPMSHADADGHCIPFCIPDPLDIDRGIGFLKELGNQGVRAINTALDLSGALTNTPVEYHVPEYEMSNEWQEEGAQLATGTAIAAAPFVGGGRASSTELSEGEEITGSSSGSGMRPQITEGVYEGPDANSPGKTYYGQSGNIPQRLQQHEASGRFPQGTPISRTEVKGGKTAREIVEHSKIAKAGGVKSEPGSTTSNVRYPIGKRREHLLKEEPK